MKAHVYVAAFAPAEGETGNQLIAHAPGSLLSPKGLPIATIHARSRAPPEMKIPKTEPVRAEAALTERPC